MFTILAPFHAMRYDALDPVSSLNTPFSNVFVISARKFEMLNFPAVRFISPMTRMILAGRIIGAVRPDHHFRTGPQSPLPKPENRKSLR